MSEKRKDNKGRLLRTGESQRKDLTYMYRYKDNDGTRRSVYAPSLTELREKEEEIIEGLRSGLIIGKTFIVEEQVKSYLRVKTSIKESTRLSYENACKKLFGTSFAKMDVREVTRSGAKLWFLEQNEAGVGYGTLAVLLVVLRCSFECALDDELIIKNPFAFQLSSVVKNDAQKKKCSQRR